MNSLLLRLFPLLDLSPVPFTKLPLESFRDEFVIGLPLSNSLAACINGLSLYLFLFLGILSFEILLSHGLVKSLFVFFLLLSFSHQIESSLFLETSGTIVSRVIHGCLLLLPAQVGTEGRLGDVTSDSQVLHYL